MANDTMYTAAEGKGPMPRTLTFITVAALVGALIQSVSAVEPRRLLAWRARP